MSVSSDSGGSKYCFTPSKVGHSNSNHHNLNPKELPRSNLSLYVQYYRQFLIGVRAVLRRCNNMFTLTQITHLRRFPWTSLWLIGWWNILFALKKKIKKKNDHLQPVGSMTLFSTETRTLNTGRYWLALGYRAAQTARMDWCEHLTYSAWINSLVWVNSLENTSLLNWVFEKVYTAVVLQSTLCKSTI